MKTKFKGFFSPNNQFPRFNLNPLKFNSVLVYFYLYIFLLGYYLTIGLLLDLYNKDVLGSNFYILCLNLEDIKLYKMYLFIIIICFFIIIGNIIISCLYLYYHDNIPKDILFFY